jgi:gamma-glutamyltranspeptidase/glutathione hydrolase
MIIMRDGKVRWVLGAPGGGRIVPTLTEMIVDLIDFEMPLEKAFRTPKFCSVFTNGHSVIQMEKGFSKDTMDALTNGYGYTLDVRKELDRFFGAPNAVEFRDDGTFLGVGSVRRAGAAAAPEK